jgi:hypothetical protein
MARAEVPPAGRENFEKDLAASQYRHRSEVYQGDPMTVIGYPVFDSFEDDRQLAGVLATNIYWRLLFTDILPPRGLF